MRRVHSQSRWLDDIRCTICTFIQQDSCTEGLARVISFLSYETFGSIPFQATAKRLDMVGFYACVKLSSG